MKKRTGFVSNSSSASFIVEAEGSWKDILFSLYHNTELFSANGCIKIIKNKINFIKKYNKPPEDAEEWKKKTHTETLKGLQKTCKNIKKQEFEMWEDHVSGFIKLKKRKDKWAQNLTDEKIKKMSQGIVRDHKIEAVKEAINALNWNLSLIDDGFVSFNVGGPSCYNGWEDIERREEFIKLVAFLTFMKYNLRTRIESHKGSF